MHKTDRKDVYSVSSRSGVEMAQQLRIQGSFGFSNIQLVKSEENSLGNGSYGAVYKAMCDQLVCAAKVLHPILFQTRDPSAYRIVERFQQEIDFLSGLRHPNVVQYLGSCADPETRMPILFMELMDESLTSFLEWPADPPPLPLHVQVDIGHDVAQALSHLHHHEVLHRDLSSNNVLLIGSRRAKVTDFGMAKLLGSDPHLTPTYCPGTNAYMSPEALADPPAYTSKLDIFSCGVLFVQIITRKWPDPGPRTRTIRISDPCVPSGRVLLEVPELERRKKHLDLISPTHPLLEVALNCLKDKEGQRPTAEQMCSRLIALKKSTAYRDSLQQTPKETTGQTPPARDQEVEQQLRECELRLTREVQQLTLQNEEQARSIQQTDELVQQKDRQLQQQAWQKDNEIHQLQQQIQAIGREKAALQHSMEQKDGVIRVKAELLQEKQSEIQTKDGLLQKKEREIQRKNELLQKKEREIKAKDELLQEKSTMAKKRCNARRRGDCAPHQRSDVAAPFQRRCMRGQLPPPPPCRDVAALPAPRQRRWVRERLPSPPPCRDVAALPAPRQRRWVRERLPSPPPCRNVAALPKPSRRRLEYEVHGRLDVENRKFHKAKTITYGLKR